MKFTSVTMIAVGLLCLYNSIMVECACEEEEEQTPGPPCDLAGTNAFVDCAANVGGPSRCDPGYICKEYLNIGGIRAYRCICPGSFFDNDRLAGPCSASNPCPTGLQCYGNTACYLPRGAQCYAATGFCVTACMEGTCYNPSK